MGLNIIRQDKTPVLPQWVETMLYRAVKLSLLRMKADPDAEVCLVLTDDTGIRNLNRQYRNQDQPTDVLSFPNGKDWVEIHGDGGPNLLGDIVISAERAVAQAVSYGHSVEREVVFLTVHGMLHLLGLDHGTDQERARMEKMQRQILLVMGLPR